MTHEHRLTDARTRHTDVQRLLRKAIVRNAVEVVKVERNALLYAVVEFPAVIRVT